MGAHVAVHFLIACWFISLFLDLHPHYFAFMPTESVSELNSLEEEPFHVLIIDKKKKKNPATYLHALFHEGESERVQLTFKISWWVCSFSMWL